MWDAQGFLALFGILGTKKAACFTSGFVLVIEQI